MNYFLVLLVAVIAVASASSYYDEDHATITFPPERPPLGLFSCNETVVSGCGISTSCESFMDACNDAQRHALVQTVEQCAHLKAKGGRLCLPDSGEFDETGNTPPLCNKVGQTKERTW